MIKAVLLKPLDGDAEGSVREFSPDEFATLERLGAVVAVDGTAAGQGISEDAGAVQDDAKQAEAPVNKMDADPANKAIEPSVAAIEPSAVAR